MKKSILILSAAALLALASCGGGNNGGGDTTEEASSSLSSIEDASSSSSSSSFVPPETKEEKIAYVNKALRAASGAAGEINGGSYTFGSDHGSFEFGQNYFHYQQTEWGDEANTRHHYFYVDGSGTTKAYSTDVDGHAGSEHAEERSLEGVDFSSHLFNPNYESGVIGGDEAASFLFTAAKNHDASLDLNVEENHVAFFFQASVVEEYFSNFTEVEAEVTFDGETGAVTSVDTTASDYGIDSVTLNEDGTFVVAEEALPTYSKSFTYNAIVGERTAVIEHHVEDFYFTSFDLTNSGETLPDGAEVTLEIDENGSAEASIHVANALPEIASSEIDKITITSEEPGLNWGNYRASDGALDLNFSEAGTYHLTIATANVRHTLTVHAVTPSASAINFVTATVNEYGGYYDEWTPLPDSIPSGASITLAALPTPINAAGTIDIQVTTSPGAGYSLEPSSWLDYDGSEKYYYIFTPVSEGDYVLTATFSADPSLTATYAVTVTAPVDPAEVLPGNYTFYDANFNTYTFAIALEGAQGTITVTETDGDGSVLATYSFAIEGDDYALTLESGTDVIGGEASLAVTPNGSVALFVDGVAYLYFEPAN